MKKLIEDKVAFPVIPEREYDARLKKVQELLARKKLDLIIAYSDDHAVSGAAHARWLADFPVHFEPVCIIIPRENKPQLLCGPESEEYAMTLSKIKEIKAIKEFSHPDEDYPYSRIFSLNEIFQSKNQIFGKIKKVGIAGLDLMNYEFYLALKNSIPEAEFIDIDKDLTMLRAIKSASELDVIRKAYQIAEIGIMNAINAVEVGVTEREISAAAECAMRRAGAEGTGIDTIVASGPNSRSILSRSTFRHIQKNDLVLITVAPRYEGYHGAIGRPIIVGNVDREIIDAKNIAKKAQTSIINLVTPGVMGRDIEAVARSIMADGGVGNYFAYSGIHSVGVIEFEPPIFGPTSNERILKDMVISIDIPLFNAPWGGLRYEDGFLVTDSGLVRLENTPYELSR